MYTIGPYIRDFVVYLKELVIFLYSRAPPPHLSKY